MINDFTASREQVVQMFRAAPGKFVWLYGREGFRDVIGPEVDTVPAEAIVYDELTADGQRAWRDFNAELARLSPGEVVPGSMGTFAVR